MKTYAVSIFESNIKRENDVAIIDQNCQRETTWKELYDLSIKVASYAKSLGLSGVVPVCMERGLEAVVTLFGLNLAGIGTSPLSFETPKERIAFIESETQNAVWTMKDYLKAIEVHGNIDFSSIEITDPALVIYTSGSTGTPKGVMLSNDAIIQSIVRSAHRYYQYTSKDITLQNSSFSFVAIILDLFSPLCAGAQVHILPEIARKDANLITKYINEHKITTAFFSPKVVRMLGKTPSIRYFLVGGERLSNFSTNEYVLNNGYGMSEMVAVAFTFPVTKSYENTPIGKPDEDFECYLIDENGNLSDEGEVCISGPVAMGYYHRPELTEKTFTKNPYSKKKGHEILLHSGDVARRLPDGNLLYLNRLDYMIKINGQRVEPGESETIIKQINGVKDAIVVGFTEDDGKTYLCAYYQAEKELDIPSCRSFLLQKLPSYMIPSFWVRLDSIPLNANGKIDRKALTRPKDAVSYHEYVAPINELEKSICQAFEQVLKLKNIGASDDFFCLGGDSIKAMEVARLLQDDAISSNDILVNKTPHQIAKKKHEKSDTFTISQRNCKNYAPLTDSQMGIYLQCIMRPDSLMYNVPMHVTLQRDENMTKDFVKKAIDNVIALHPAMYAFLKPEGETIFMCRNFFPTEGICQVSECENEWNENEKLQFVQPFSLFKGPLCRVEVLLTKKHLHIYIDCHHVVCDGSSMTLFLQQIQDALLEKPLQEETVDGFDVYEWEQLQKEESKINQAKDYFANLLIGNEVDSNLLYDYPVNENTSYLASQKDIFFTIPQLTAYLKKYGVTESSFFMGVFGYTLAKMTGQTESLFSVVENGRTNAQTDKTISMLVRTLPMLYHLDESQHANTFLQNGQEQFFKSMQNDVFSFDKIANEFGVSSDVMFVYQSDMLINMKSISVEQIPVNEAFANFAVSVWKHENNYQVHINYRKECYKNTTIERFLRLFENVAHSFSKNSLLKEIPLLSDCDLKALNAFNDTTYVYDESQTILDLFRKSLSLYPNKTCVVYLDKKYTYQEVEDLSNAISSYIHRLGIKKGETVSILIPRCEYMLIASLGVLKSGAIYQPLDPTYPSERLKFMCQDADSKLLIADANLLNLLPEYTNNVLTLDEIPNLPKEIYDANPSPSDGFVLLYTSGTTGLPKGCKLLHRNIVAFVHAFQQLFSIDETCVSGAYASYGFDAHLSEIYPPISVGGELHIIPENIRLDLPVLKSYYEDNKVTNTVMTTQIARQFVTEYPTVKYLKAILCGGEKLATVKPPLSYRFVNGYGPSESTVMVTCFSIDKQYENIPIGKALPNTKLYVVDAQNRRVPIGVPGELIACGPQVAEGYINRPEKTSEVFVTNTFEDSNNPIYDHCYKTGDIVRYLEDGNLEIIGRHDQQVKIRGFRIELSEIETVLREYPDVTDATVVARDDAAGGKCIHAYIVANNQVDISALNAFIKERKPSYMVPAATMQIDAIPLTPNFKVDKRKLPEINISSRSQKNLLRQRTDLEIRLSEILSEIVGHQNFNVETEFVDAGITSISSIKLAVQIYKKFGLHISSKDILDGGTIISVENAIVSMFLEKKKEQKQEKKQDTYALTQSQLGIYTDCLRRGMDAYLIPVLLELHASTEKDKLISAIQTAVMAHPSMHCHIYANNDGTPMVHTLSPFTFDIEYVELDTLTFEPTHFTFDQHPLFRIRLFKVQNKCYLCVEMHHIIADGESLQILLKDIALAYNGQPILEEKYTAWDKSKDEENARNSKDFESAKAYYDSIFRGVSTDYLPAPCRFETPSFGEYTTEFSVAKNTIQDYCKSLNVSENIFFTGAFALTLAKFTSHQDALFSTIHNGRDDPRFENMVTMAVKTIPVYIDLPQDASMRSYLHRLDDRLRKLKKYDIFSFADAARTYGVSSEPMFIYQGNMMQECSLGEFVKTQPANAPKTAFSLEVSLNEHGYSFHAEYNAGQYDEVWIHGFLDAYAQCIQEFIHKNTLGEISICSQNALQKFQTFNATEWDIPKQPACQLFEDCVDNYPNKKAVICGDQSLTYLELDHMANNLARKICSIGIPQESTVSLLLDRTKEIYISELGVLKSANFFLCLSPDYPDERISYILEDSATKVIVTTHALFDARKNFLSTLDIPVLFADDIKQTTKEPRLHLNIDPESLAYMIYTSGSTGKPKGVMVQHKGLVTIAHKNPKNMETILYANDTTISTAVSSFTFDASIMEGLVALFNGSTVCIASNNQIHDPEAFCKYCLENNVNTILGTPSYLLNLSDYKGFAPVARNLRTILAGGEEFTTVLLKNLLNLNPNLCVLNGYGPSEATVTCSCQQLHLNERITIGTPLANTKLYCTDAQNHILPMGAMGELTIVGDGVGKGYLHREDLTQKAFIQIHDTPAFKTGDLAIITHQGLIEFHGRIDNQVKIRGLRIELGEIENVINTIEGMKSSVVIVKGEGENKYLAAYFTANRPISKEEILEIISQKLAKYMIPRHFMQLDEMPLTANGKIDKKALPEILTQRKAKTETSQESSGNLKIVTDLFANLLHSEEILPEDNFFDMGGNSLLASRVVMQLKSQGFELEYQTIFDYQTPKALAAFLDKSTQASQIDVTNNGQEKLTGEQYREVLQYNALPYAEQTQRLPLGNVVLTGAVGFLGIHILNELLQTEKGHIYCLVRKGKFPTPINRLNAISFYYFGKSLQEAYPERITVVDADITSENLLTLFKDISFDTLINCAASVKHFAKDNSIEYVNVHGVENLITLVKSKNAKLIQISTTSVPGVHTEESLKNHVTLHENDLFMVDNMNNQYIISKYHAEQCILQAIKDGMHGKIIRVGNLMGRYSDGEFQINMGSNAFLNALKGFTVIGKFPVGHSTEPMEFSPVDCTAKAIVALAGTNDKFTLFHANSRYTFDEMILMQACTACNLPIVPTNDKEYYEEYNRLLGDANISKYLSALVTNDRPGIHSVEVDNRFTASVLYRIGFSWPIIDEKYLERVINGLKDLGFFDWNYGS